MKFYGYSIIVDIGEKHESSGFSRGGCTLEFYIFTSFKAEHLKKLFETKDWSANTIFSQNKK